MGLIAAGLSAISGSLADQWKEFFYCDSLDADTLLVRGQKQAGGKKGSDNIISNGSGIVVADGQCMIIVDQGKIVEFCAEPGQFTYDSSSSPSIFSGNFGEQLVATFKDMWERFTYGGEPGKVQRVYYFNTKELTDNKFGTPNPIPFRVVDKNIGLDIDVAVRCSGVYSYKVTNPLLFYTNVAGNVQGAYTRDMLDSQLKTEFVSALQPVFGKLSYTGLRPSELPAHANELCDLMNEELTKKWGELRGLSVISVALNPITLTEEDAEIIKNAQKAAINRDPTMAGATLIQGQVDAMRDAANNANGAMAGFMGVNMAGGVAGNTAANLFAMGAQQAPAAPQAPAADVWTCPGCGHQSTGKFCTECGTKKPQAQGTWVCPTCGRECTGKFCSECGTKRPESQGPAKCPACGFEIADPATKFCPDCGAKLN
jgi:membrane protease subunit (stomatin/prohibitin family)